ncbi:MAG TPA: hypothetical protein PLE28_02620 [bacterium]|nr:hypothetical protein [bacterium]
MNIIGGLILIALGTLIIIKTEFLLENFGRIAWFEEKLGSEGGSRLGYKLIGLIIIFFGLLLTTGMFGDFMTTALSPLVK